MFVSGGPEKRSEDILLNKAVLNETKDLNKLKSSLKRPTFLIKERNFSLARTNYSLIRPSSQKKSKRISQICFKRNFLKIPIVT